MISICIPTYNRSSGLRQALERLIAQISASAMRGVVQICISDNGSDDDTKHVVQSLSNSLNGTLIYRRLLYNHGFAFNLLSAANLASGEYVTFTGDDDSILPGGIHELIKAAMLGYNLVLMNTWPGECVSALQLSAGETILLHDTYGASRLLGVFHPSFIGNILIRRSLFQKHADPGFARSAYPHVGVVLRTLRVTPGLFINAPVFQVGLRGRRWNHYQPVYTAVDMARLYTEEVFQHGSSRNEIWTVSWKLVKNVPRILLSLRLGAIKSEDGNPYAELSLSNMRACYRCSRLFELICLVLWWSAKLCPIFLLRAILCWRWNFQAGRRCLSKFASVW